MEVIPLGYAIQYMRDSAMYFVLGLGFVGFIFEVVGAFKARGDLMLDGFLLQASAILLAIPLVV